MADVMTFGASPEEGHHSDTKTFSVTSVGNADMRIENFSQSVTECTPDTKFNQDSPIATFDLVNRGTAGDMPCTKYLSRTAGEATWNEIYYACFPSINPEEKWGPLPFPVYDWTCPSAGTTTEFAIKVWGKDTEGEPPDPA